MNRKKSNKKIVACGLLLVGVAANAWALEVDREVLPRIMLGGRVMPSLDAYQLDSGADKKDGVNLDDSTLLMRFDKRLYENGVAGAVLGFKEQDDALRYSELNAFFWNRDVRFMLGQSRLRNTLLEFPTLRDDDLITYTHVGNASSNEGEFDSVYARQLAADWFVDQKVQRLGVWAATRRADGSVPASSNMNSFGISYIYEQPENLRYVKWLRHAGVALDRQRVKLAADNEWMNALIAGAEFNLNMDPRKNWSVAAQVIRSQGAGTVATLDSTAVLTTVNRARAESTAVVTSLRYTARPKLLTRWQAGLSLAYKDYADANDGSQWSVVPSLFYRLGQGVDLVTQYIYTDYGDGLGGGTDQTLQLGLSFSFDTVFNDTIGERDSILNLEHGYIQ